MADILDLFDTSRRPDCWRDNGRVTTARPIPVAVMLVSTGGSRSHPFLEIIA